MIFLQKSYKFISIQPVKQIQVQMERRSKSKVVANLQQQDRPKSSSKPHKNDSVIDRKCEQKDDLQKLKQNILISLTHMFLQSQNTSSIIYPWMKQFKQLEDRIIGTNYIIIGPTQSGKYSAVKYALGTKHQQLQEILINCDFNTTQYQFFCKILQEFRLKGHRDCWPKDENQINRIFTPDNIDFAKLNPYIKKSKIKFVIIVRNGQHLVGFKKQTILYNLFEWMASEAIQSIGGLVILTKQLRLTDLFQKRIKSRFCGNRLCIFRPQDPNIFIQILIKRIQAVINDRQVWIRSYKLHNSKIQIEDQYFFQSADESQVKVKNKSKPSTKVKLQESINFQKILKKYQDNSYIKSLNQYALCLNKYFDKDEINQSGIKEYFGQKLIQFQRSKNKEKYLFSEQPVLQFHQQIQCLYKLKEAVENNKELSYFIQSRIKEQYIITIPFVLLIFQTIFLKLDQTLIKYLPIEKLKRLIYKMFKKGFEAEFPNHDTQNNCLQNFNNVELLILIYILKHIESDKNNSIKLADIYHTYKNALNIQINKSSERSSNKIPRNIIQRSIDRLYCANVIKYSPQNKWNSQIQLKYEVVKIKQGLKQLVKARYLSQMFIEELRNLNIQVRYGQVENIYVNMTLNKS